MSSGDKQIQPGLNGIPQILVSFQFQITVKGSGTKPLQNTAEGYVHPLKIIWGMQGRLQPN